jgi:hypothetical protein
LEAVELFYEDTLAASFVILLAAPIPEGLFEDPLARQAAEAIVNLLEAGKDEQTFREAVTTYGPRARSKFRSLLEALHDEDTGITLVVAPPEAPLTQGNLSAPLVRSSLLLLRSTDTQVSTISLDRATLVGGHSRTGSFELYDNAADKRYNGKVEPEARAQIAGLTIGDEYSAVLLQELEHSDVGEEVKPIYRLLSIQSRSTH